MNILEAIKQQRNDIKTWTKNNLISLDDKIKQIPTEVYVGDGDMPETATIQILMDGSDEEKALKDELKEYIDGEMQTAKDNGEFDGKTAYAYAQDGGYAGTEEEFATKLAKEYNPNPLWNKKVSLIGDSICAGSGYAGGYGKIIAERNNMTYQNLGQGGATITAETYSSSTGGAKGWICRMVANMDADSDYAIVEGGLNDAWQYFDHGTITIGEITEGYNATLDDTTYYGAFESMLKQLVTKFQGKKIGYIAVPKMMDLYDSERNVPNFYHIALECCAKWGVPVCDLNVITPPFEYIKSLGTTYTTDGTHPTYEGYLAYYCDPIEAWMKTLTTGGNSSAVVARKAVEEYTKGFNDAIKALQDGKLDNTGISFRKALLPLADGTTLEIDVLTAIDGTVVIKYTNRIPLSIDSDGTVFGSDYNGDGKNDGYLFGKRLSSSGAVKDGNDSYTKSSVTGFIPVKSGDIVRIFGCKWATTKHAMNYICGYNSNFTFIGAHATTTGTASPTLNVHTANVATLTDFDDNLNVTLTIANNSSIAYIRVSCCGETQTEGIDFANAIITVNEEIV